MKVPVVAIDGSSGAVAKPQALVHTMFGFLFAGHYLEDLPWIAYGGDLGGSRYSPALQIDRTNVEKLKLAWKFRHGDMAAESGQPKSSFECTPIMIDGTLYFSTPFSRVIALDARTGARKWSFDPKVVTKKPKAVEPLVHRGVAYGFEHIYIGTYDARLFCLDAKTGEPDKTFAGKGYIDLTKGLERVDPKTYQIASPPVVVGDVVVIGSTIGDNNEARAGDGSIRAFDAKSGKLRWSFDPAPKGSGAANAWAAMSADPILETVFVPTSSPSPDHYGGSRISEEGLGNSLVALDANTGAVKWSFQVVRHDVWDYDIPAQPILTKAKGRPAVVVLTKMGFVFVLDRETGKPLFPIEERAVWASALAGEKLSVSQPVPTLPPPLLPNRYEPWGRNEQELAFAQHGVEGLTGGSIFTPPDEKGIIEYPGTLGGCSWSGGAVDPASRTLFTNINNLATIVRLIPNDEIARFRAANPGSEVTEMKGTPYGLVRGPLMTREQVPAVKPPWGEMVAIDLDGGSVRWRRPLGISPRMKGLPDAEKWGSLNLGGGIVTGGGLLFVSGTQDGAFRALDVSDGRTLWQTDLPAGGNATPMTYLLGGKQFVVICAGGHSGFNTTIGDYVLAYALPEP